MTPITRLPDRPRERPALPWLLAAVAIAAIVALRGLHPAAAGHQPRAEVSLVDPAQLPAVATAEHHSLDYARLGSRIVELKGVSSLRVARGTPLTLYGWAVDAGAHRPASLVYATLGGVSIPARGRLARSDVAAALGDPAYAPSGFALDIATANLPLGPQTLALFGVNAGATGRYDLGEAITLFVAAR
jgi:hypothetical protein